MTTRLSPGGFLEVQTMAFADWPVWIDWLVKTSIGGALWGAAVSERNRRMALADERRKQLTY
jgi:hypothetical protein